MQYTVQNLGARLHLETDKSESDPTDCYYQRHAGRDRNYKPDHLMVHNDRFALRPIDEKCKTLMNSETILKTEIRDDANGYY